VELAKLVCLRDLAHCFRVMSSCDLRWRTPAVWLCIVLSGLPWFESARASGGDPSQDDFSPDELRRLEQGELVTRPAVTRPGRPALMGGTSWQVIDRSPDAVWALLLDASQYPRTLPQVVRAEIVQDSGVERTLLLEHGNALVQLSYYLSVRIDPRAHQINFRVDESRPHDIRSGAGFYLLRPYANQKTLLVYGVLADIGDRFFVQLLRANVQEWLLKVPWLVKRVAESKPRALPVRRSE
jgi:hypothetical protein